MNLKETFDSYSSIVNCFRDISYSVEIQQIQEQMFERKYVGAQFLDDMVIGIPNEAIQVLCFGQSDTYFGNLETGNFKWTGSWVWNGDIYCFPRSENRMLIINPNQRDISYWNSDYLYNKEHHYGGVMTPDGKIYQPPRSESDIHVWDVRNHLQYKIHIGDESYRYCCSIFYPPNTIYFLPERNQKVIKLSTIDDTYEFIGDNLMACVFDAKIATDGNIYGYSAREHGLIKITASDGRAEMIHTEIWGGAYGTKIGLNGKLYSIPGDGDNVWEYDPTTDELMSIYRFESKIREKYAGGVTCPDGVIMGMPIKENSILKLIPSREGKIASDVYNTFYCDSY